MVTKLIDSSDTAKNIIAKIKEKVPADVKPSKLVGMLSSPISNQYITTAFNEVRDGIKESLSAKGAGYRRKHHKRK